MKGYGRSYNHKGGAWADDLLSTRWSRRNACVITARMRSSAHRAWVVGLSGEARVVALRGVDLVFWIKMRLRISICLEWDASWNQMRLRISICLEPEGYRISDEGE